jgi:hypothetical protein
MARQPLLGCRRDPVQSLSAETARRSLPGEFRASNPAKICARTSSAHTRSHTHAQSARTHSVTRSSTFGSVSRRFALLLLLSAPPRATVPFFLHPAKVVFCLFWRRSLLRRRARGAYTASPRPSQRVSRQVSRSARVSWEAACGLCHCRRPVRSLSC